MATTAPMHKNRTTTMGRISGFISNSNIFKNINLSSKLYSDTTPLTTLTHWRLPANEAGEESGAWKDYTFAEIITQSFTPAQTGDDFGPTWSTHWFKIEIDVPTAWTGREVHIRWNSNSEAAIYNTAGTMLQGLTPGYREEYLLSRSWDGSTTRLTFYIEMSCNGMFGAGQNDMIGPTNNNQFFRLDRAEIAVFERPIYKVYTDIEILYQMADQMSNDHRGYQAMFAANEMINLIREDNYDKASEIADAFFAEGVGKKAHTLYSMGYCHIDTAWLWPYDETIRKVARSWSAQLGLMREYEELYFTCSSAQQYEWLELYHPEVFRQVKQFVAQGRFLPVGGTWIEMDGNVPSGESFMRQFFYGQRYYQEKFAVTCKEFWLPDTFGYSAQIPQILRHVGIGRFLTQKMSWNLVNKFPNHNFFWEGIDGTQVLTHFPPGDSYNMNGTVNELLYTVNNSQDKGRANSSIYLYGFGDGGGGPTRSMIERQKRAQNVDGLPKIVFTGPDEFFTELEKESGKLSKWVGELYLELHNGTYTSQARIKWYNRKAEFFLREVEYLMGIALVQGKVTEAQFNTDQAILDRCWKNVLLNQFHDILPGSCIELAAKVAWGVYAESFTNLLTLRGSYNALILGTGTTNKAVFNSLPWDVKMVIFNQPDTGSPPSGANTQAVDLKTTVEDEGEGRFRVPSQFTAVLVEAKAGGYSQFAAAPPTNSVQYADETDSVTFSNGIVKVEHYKNGLPNEIINFTGPSGKEQPVFADRLGTGIQGGQFYVYDDVPLYWDAWDVMDYHLETRRLPAYTNSPTSEVISQGPIVGISKWTGTFGNSTTIERYTIVRAYSPMVEYYTIVDWREEHKLLKVEFPVDILSREATYEIQYGHAKRPTHMNTSWDMAKFEVCGHKWMDISQADKGVSILTDSKYGWHVRDNIVKLSLLKSAKNPDANADMHKHYIYYAVLPHEGTFQESEVIRRAYELNVFAANNVPLLATGLAEAQLPQSWVVADNAAVVVEAFKVAADNHRAVVVRLYESHGGAAQTTISLGFPITKVQVCNGLEEPAEDVVASGNTFPATFRPFEIKSFLVSF